MSLGSHDDREHHTMLTALDEQVALSRTLRENAAKEMNYRDKQRAIERSQKEYALIQEQKALEMQIEQENKRKEMRKRKQKQNKQNGRQNERKYKMDVINIDDEDDDDSDIQVLSPPMHGKRKTQSKSNAIARAKAERQAKSTRKHNDDSIRMFGDNPSVAIFDLSSDEDENDSNDNDGNDGTDDIEMGNGGGDDSMFESPRTSASENGLKDEGALIRRIHGLKLMPFRPNTLSFLERQLSEYYHSGDSQDNVILSTHDKSKSELKIHDIKTLAPGTWVNDEVINFYMALLQERNNERRKDKRIEEYGMQRKCVFINSYFYSKLNQAIQGTNRTRYCYKNVKRWTKQLKLSKALDGEDVSSIFDCDKVIFPINQGNMHWVLGCINMREHKIEYYDSMGSTGSRPSSRSKGFNTSMTRYIQDEWNDKMVGNGHEVGIDMDQWEYVDMKQTVPQQNNGYDCGVFACKFADWISDDLFPDFSQNDIPYFRSRISAELIKAELADNDIPTI